jgi:hypothetical protein
VKLTDPGELRRANVRSITRPLLPGELGYQDALGLVYRYAVGPLGHPADLASWCFVWEGLNPKNFSDLSSDETDRAVRTLARQWSDYRTGLVPRSIQSN